MARVRRSLKEPRLEKQHKTWRHARVLSLSTTFQQQWTIQNNGSSSKPIVTGRPTAAHSLLILVQYLLLIKYIEIQKNLQQYSSIVYHVNKRRCVEKRSCVQLLTIKSTWSSNFFWFIRNFGVSKIKLWVKSKKAAPFYYTFQLSHTQYVRSLENRLYPIGSFKTTSPFTVLFLVAGGCYV